MQWTNTTVGDFCPFVYGKAIKKQDQLNKGIPVYGSNGIYTYSANELVSPYTVVIGRKGSVGKLHISFTPCWVSDTAFYVKQETLEETYFTYYLLSTLGLENMNTDAAVPGLNRDNAHRLKVRIPESAAERKRLIAPLIALDKKINLNNEINQTLEQMAQAIFKSWFVDFEPVKAKIAALEAGGSEDDALLAAMQAIAGSALFATDAADADAQTQLAHLQAEHPEQYTTLRATAELFPSAMQESELGEIPEGWEVLPLSQMVELIGGGTPKRSEPAYWNGDICWFSVKDAPSDGNVFVIDTVEKITDAGLKGSSTKLLPLGTTIITARGTVGKLALTGVVTAMNPILLRGYRC